MGRGKEDREGGGGRGLLQCQHSQVVLTVSHNPPGFDSLCGADVSCPLFPPSSGAKTLGTGREGPTEHLGMDVRGGLAG